MKAFGENPPDLVITDFNMPGMNALDFLEEFRKIPEFEDIPVVVISSQNETDNRHRALLAGATDFLMVPFDTFEFQARNRNLLKLSLHQKSLKSQSRSLHSELLEARHRSLETQHRFVSIIDSVPAMVFAINAAGECVFANYYCFDFFGIPADEGVTAVQFLADRVNAETPRSKRSGALQPQEIALTGRDGREHVFLLAPKPVEDGALEAPFVVYSGIQITQLKKTERSLRRAKNAAEVANRAKSAFLSNMTHEIRTPLNAIIGFTDVICNEMHGPIGNATYKAYLGDVQSSARHLLTIINEILEFSQIEAQRQQVTISDFSLRECLGELGDKAVPELQARGNRLVVDTIPDVTLRFDREKLNQVLYNILSNANHATDGGTIRVVAKLNSGGSLIVKVKDDGIGMDDAELDVAVTEFGRVMTPAFISDGRTGAGLGLPISIRLMQLLGGELDIESRKGVGTTVRITLPRTMIVDGPANKRAGSIETFPHKNDDAGDPQGT